MVKKTLFKGAVTMGFCSPEERSGSPQNKRTNRDLEPRSRIGSGGGKLLRVNIKAREILARLTQLDSC